jgi:hypothetical protein
MNLALRCHGYLGEVIVGFDFVQRREVRIAHISQVLMRSLNIIVQRPQIF